jgi:hypothetical protein
VCLRTRTKGHERVCELLRISGSHGGEYEDNSVLMIEAVRISETSVYFETIRRYMPEGCHLQGGYLDLREMRTTSQRSG